MKKDELYKDQGLRQALQHRNEVAKKLTPSADFADSLMARIQASEVAPQSKRRRLWTYVSIGAVAASILLLLTLHFWQKTEETPQSVVAKQDPPKQTITVKKPEVVPQKKVVAKVAKRQEVVEEKEKVQELPAAPVEEELMAVVEESVYDPMIEDPYAFVMNQMQDIRSRGERLQQEVALAMVTE